MKFTQEEAEAKSLIKGIRLIGKYTNCDTKTLFECPYCHRCWYAIPTKIWRGHTQSCGCLGHYNIINKQFGKLTVLYKAYDKKYQHYNKSMFMCRCECGIELIVGGNHLVYKHTSSCGKCYKTLILKNGIPTSKIALKLHAMLGNYGEHNKWIEHKNFDIVFPNNIVVEYDCVRWHYKHTMHNNARNQWLIRRGYKILRIRSDSDLPPQYLLDKAIFELIMTRKKQITITLPGWKKRLQYFQRKDK